MRFRFPALAIVASTVLLSSAAAPELRPTVLVLTTHGAEAYAEAAAAAVANLNEAEGNPVTVRRFEIPGMSRQAARALGEKPSAVLAVGSQAVKFAHSRGPDVPLVYSMVFDPDALGLADNPASPPPIGVSMRVPLSEQFTFIRTVMPNLRRLGVLYDPGRTAALVEEARLAAEQVGLELIAMPVRSGGEVMKAARLLSQQVEGFWAMPDPTVLGGANGRALTLYSLRSRRPMFAAAEAYVRRGALGAICADPTAVGRRSAELTLDVGRGALDGPVAESPPKTRVFLNRSSAGRLGIELHDELIQRIDPVFAGS